MRLTGPLRAPPPRFPLDLHPLARLREGRLDLTGPAFPPEGPLLLVLWHPGAEPAFSLVEGELRRGWAWSDPAADGWVVLWARPGAPAQPF